MDFEEYVIQLPEYTLPEVLTSGGKKKKKKLM